MTLQVQQLLASPDIYPQRIEGADIVFVRMSRHSYQQSLFTDNNRIVTAGDDAWAVPLAEVVNIVEQSGSTNPAPAFIFQIAHCGSTLLSRAMDQPGKSLVIREPFVLRQLAAMAAPDGGDAGRSTPWSRGMASLLFLLGRQYDVAERVLVKANVPVNFVLSGIHRLSPDLAAIALYSELPDFLVAALKSDERRRWAQYVCRELSKGIGATTGLSGIDTSNLGAAESAAVLWFAQIEQFRAALAANPEILPLQSEALFQHPGETLQQCASHLSIEMPAENIDQLVESDLFARHAKQPERAFSNDDRLSERERLRNQYQHEISEAVDWCKEVGLDENSTLPIGP